MRIEKIKIFIRKKLSQYLRLVKMLRFYSRLIKRGELCLDVGANMGDRTNIFLKLGATVVAVEPQENCVKNLVEKYGKMRRFKVERKVLSDKEEKIELNVCRDSILSSVSREWIESVKKSGRFLDHNWEKTTFVEATRLDSLIKIYGRPKFCKIDVEGHELNVLRGLTEPIKYIAFEFTPERKEEAVKCVDYLAAMGEAVFNYSPEESMRFLFKKWVSPQEIKDYIASIPVISGNAFNWGDIYVNFYRMY